MSLAKTSIEADVYLADESILSRGRYQAIADGPAGSAG